MSRRATGNPERHHGSHAGPRRGRHGREVPQPSFAERTRTLLHRQRTGYLSTMSRRRAGFPFGSVMPYALDPQGRPLLLISKMAMHTKNLDRDPRASLLVPEDDAARDPLGAARATLVGRTAPVPEGDLEAVRDHYLERQENARYYVDYADFGFYRMEVADVYYVGGFGVMGWVDAGEYAQAAPDPLADHAPGILEHMNRDHLDALRLLAARANPGVEIEEANMTAVDRLGFHLRFRTQGRFRGCRIAFPREARDPAQTREVMVELVREARRPDSSRSNPTRS